MARKLRIQSAGAFYHIINRGNYRRDLFETVGAAQAFEEALNQTCQRYGWRLHAYVIMRDHYHLALMTPRPNLVEGMHWLQSTFATRFNRFRTESGHLFQGRYKALLIEDAAALVKVVNFIHLNPVRTGLVMAVQVGDFRWSSLGRFIRGAKPEALSAHPWFEQGGWKTGDTENWAGYRNYLIKLADDPVAQARQEFGVMSQGWAIGSRIWRNAVARDHAHLALSVGLPRAEMQEIKENLWLDILSAELKHVGKSFEEILHDKKSASWKLTVAENLRRLTQAPYRWIAKELNMGRPASLRVFLCRARAKNGRGLLPATSILMESPRA